MNIKISIRFFTLILALIVTLAYSSSWTGQVVAVAVNDTISIMFEGNALKRRTIDDHTGPFAGRSDPKEVSP